MADWLNAILFGVALVTVVLGLTSIIMAFMSDKQGADAMKERIEYGFLGLSALTIAGLVGYVLA
ncbi:hypothetical protein [Alteromonas oceanisediminis]|uniref:hypothetical protein n=1 Tax=Alteromonas oceanisediminis TaxID=2836180 RepID=UPI001BDADD00|nr:hypothetical protein [Alteromonas oceanisediminis]MBT0585873.1 hypothetical protein [Alteromonas oceanisediminis]